jgi:formylglycine-generating enzyme required for sulfatase activity
MEPNSDPELRNLLEEWQTPALPASLEERVLGARRRWWRFLLRGSFRIPVPVAACLAVLMAVAVWRLARAPASPNVVGSGRVEIPTAGNPATTDQAKMQSFPTQPPTAVSPQAKTKVNWIDGLTYVWIPPGAFQMGCSPNDTECSGSAKPADSVNVQGSWNERPTHSVKITKGFWIGQTEVTQAAYKNVVGGNPSYFPGDQMPVEQVSWEDARNYCETSGMRLPTEAEWEYAARGGSALAYYAPIERIAWYRANSDLRTHDVAQLQPNAYGLYDMLGNVWEWVADWYGPYDGSSAVDPKGPPTGQYRVVRGGSLYVLASVVRVSMRNGMDPGWRDAKYGFRCAGN